MPMQWNEQADAKLFANVLKLHVVKLDYQALAKAMGDTVTPKAISHRISKIKEKAQVRRLDSETDNNPPTSATPKKRGPKIKTVDDEDIDDVPRKRIKLEGPMIKVEENAYDDSLENPTSRSVGDYFWAGVWSPVTASGELQHHYDPYDHELEEKNNNGADDSDVGYGNSSAGGNVGLDEDCSSAYGNSST